MEKILFVRHDEYLKHMFGYPNQIDEWLEKLKVEIQKSLPRFNETFELKLEKDKYFDSTSTLGERMVVASNNLLAKKFLDDKGPFLLIVSAN